MREIAAMARAERPLIVSDEIYHGLVYEGQDHSILEFTDRAFVLNGFSKLYAMTGLRLGYVIAPPGVHPPPAEAAAELLHLGQRRGAEGGHRRAEMRRRRMWRA